MAGSEIQPNFFFRLWDGSAIEHLMLTCSVIAFACGLFYFAVERYWLHIVLHLAGPLMIALAFYWFPNLDQLGSAEYRTWAPVYVCGMMMYAFPASLAAGFLSWIIRKKLGQPSPPPDSPPAAGSKSGEA